MLADDINEQIKAGRQTMEESDLDMQEPETARQMPSAGVMLGVGMAIVGLGVLGWLIYRRRQQSRTLVQQLAHRLPVVLDDMRDELRTQLKRADRLPGAFDDFRDELRTQLKRVRSR
jgi:Flp pilus assembly protein TadB